MINRVAFAGISFVAFIATTMLHQVTYVDAMISEPLNTCERQAACAELQVVMNTDVLMCEQQCEYEVCLRFYKAEDGDCPNRIKHSCEKPEVLCRGQNMERANQSGFPKKLSNGFGFARKNNNIPLEYIECQVVGPNQLVEFLIMDGDDNVNGCAAGGSNAELEPLSGIGLPAQCSPRPATTETCTNKNVGVECVWTYYTPDCDGNPYWPGTATEPEPEPEPETSSGVSGDPHFKTWDGELYDFHGICDLVLLQNPKYKKGLGMEIHVRSKKTRQWSYVSTAVLRIGDETLEVAGKKDGDTFWINGVIGTAIHSNPEIAGYPIKYEKLNSQQKLYTVDIGNEQKIVIKTWKDMVRVDVKGAKPEDFEGSFGLMGAFPTGEKIGRDMKTAMINLNDFGQEWQVRADEPMLFHNFDGVQAPVSCEIPTKTSLRRHLATSSISLEDAEIACARVSGEDRDLCIFDVMAMNDREVAGAY